MSSPKSMEEILSAIRTGMTDDDACAYVPVEKFTIAVSLTAMRHRCDACEEKECSECTIPIAMDKLLHIIKEPALFDKDFNLIVPKESEG